MQEAAAENFVFSSSVKGDVWHPQKDDKSYEWWYFDALSDDGREAIVVIFLDNFIYSPRYNQESTKITGAERCPAVSFTYFRDGKPLYRTTTEFHHSDFRASEQIPECRIGGSGFSHHSGTYGSGYLVDIHASLPGGKVLDAKLEWLSVESDFTCDSFNYQENRHGWNMVVPRSDVTGHISISRQTGKTLDELHFRGTGYHDHNIDNRWLAKTVRDWHWGRAHFSDRTAVFFRFRELGEDEANTKLIIVRDGEMQERNVAFEEQSYVRDKLGIRYPAQLHLVSDDEVRLHVRPVEVIDSSFYFLRFLSEITLTGTDRIEHKSMGITEFIAPKTLRYRWLNWLADVRTGKNGKSSYF